MAKYCLEYNYFLLSGILTFFMFCFKQSPTANEFTFSAENKMKAVLSLGTTITRCGALVQKACS